MKKVKIMLTAITVFAVIGGAFAFKSYKNPRRTIYVTSAAKPDVCDVAILATTTDNSSANPLKYTLTQSSPCIDGFTTNQE